MRLRHRIATALALLLALLAMPALAQASKGGDRVQKDCSDGTLSGHYSQKDYADALSTLPADLDEYSDCRDQIHRAQLGGGESSGGGSGNSGGGGGTTGGGTTGGGAGTAGGATSSGANGDTGATPSGAPVDPLASATAAERAAFQKAVADGDAPVKLDGRPISPSALGGSKTNGVADLPAPLLAILALLALGGLGAAGFGTRRLVHGRRPA
jgi:hypothetical protein